MSEESQSALTVVEPKIPTVGEMLQGVIASGVTKENVDAIKEMVGLYERMQDREAVKEFTKAFVAMQDEMKQVQATKPVHAKDGSIKFKVAPPEEIDAQARPIYQKYGFAVSFSEGKSETGRISKVCRLQHISGYFRENTYTCRIGSGPPGATESQADGSAHSYAKRGALCDSLNIVIAHQEEDPRNEGGTITTEQAIALADRVLATKSDAKAFLRFAGADDFESIPAVKYDLLDKQLRRKEQKR